METIGVVLSFVLGLAILVTLGLVTYWIITDDLPDDDFRL